MRIEFKNFRCLRDTALELTPLTVIVGPNASGKSSILEALNPDYSLHPADAWQRREGQGVVVRRIGADAARQISVMRGSTGIQEKPARGFEFNYQGLRLDTGVLRSGNTVSPAFRLGTRGENLTNLFDTLDRATQAELVRQFCGLVPVFADVNAKPHGADGQKHLVFKDRWNPSAEYAPSQVSDGSMLVFAFLALRYQREAPDVLAIEELERGIHPYLIGELISFLRGLSGGAYGGGEMKVVIATHSPEVLEFTQPDEARFLTRQSDGSVQIQGLPLKEKHWPQAFENYKKSLGSAWLAGGVGGVPSR